MPRQVELGVFRGRARDGDLFVVAALEDEAPQLAGAPAPVARAAERWRAGEASRGRRPFDAGSVDGVGVVCRELGPREGLDTRKVTCFVREAVETAADRRSERLILVLPDHEQLGAGAGREHVLVSAASAAYRYGEYLTARDEARLGWIGVTADPSSRAEWRADLAAARAVAAGIRITRDLANTPPNLATPAWMAAEVRRLAERHGGSGAGADGARARAPRHGRDPRRGRRLRRTRRGCVRMAARQPRARRWRWSARASPSTPAASRSSRRPTWTR